jgi:hypothetical protein
MLSGEYSCCYCREQCASDCRFHIFVSNDAKTQMVPAGPVGNPLYFCTPECACGYNKYMSRDPMSESCGNRHRLLEKRYGRRIVCAPPPQLLAQRAVPRKNGIERNVWLEECRRELSREEQYVAWQEMQGNEDTLMMDKTIKHARKF